MPTVEGLQQRASVQKSLLSRLVLKELADNGFDNGATGVTARELGQAGAYVVEDNGPGIEGTPEDTARFGPLAVSGSIC